MRAQTLEGGFTDPAVQAARAFRAVMEAMARPGTIHGIDGAVPPAPLSPAAGAALLTLCDTDTPIHLAGALDTDDLRRWIAFHTGAPAQDAEFVLYHADNVQATGFLEHIKLPHYVDFQSKLELVRKLRREADSAQAAQSREAAECADG